MYTKTMYICVYIYIYISFVPYHEPGGAVVWGTTLQAGRSRVRFSMVSLEFFIEIILPAALWPRGSQLLREKVTMHISCVVKGAGA